MINNRDFIITTANTRKAILWARTKTSIIEFANRLSTAVRGTETYEQYLKLPKGQQDERKDVGGFVGGSFSGTRRKANELLTRSVITLDLDNLPPGSADDVLRRVDSLGCCATVYSTRKHAPWQPRLRIVIYLHTDCTSEEYEPIARMVAYLAFRDCMDWLDPTTFEASRLMYWPSVCADGEYIFRHYDKGLLNGQAVLDMYPDWHDVRSWPTVPGHEAVDRKSLEKAGDPREKGGIVGAFCKAYTVTRAMEELIPGVYVPTGIENRYSYYESNSFGGALVYDDLFLYSHHAKDPAQGKLLNAFDLVRIHKFWHLDDDAKPGTPINRVPSFTAMTQYVGEIPEVKQSIFDNRPTAMDVFDVVPVPPEDRTWTVDIKTSGDKTEKSRQNILLILKNDERVKDKFVTDEFSNRGLVIGAFPWDPRFESERRWGDADDSGIRWFFEAEYGIEAPTKIEDALRLTGWNRRINVVHDYLKALTWDGVPRIDTMLTDYLGVEDNLYTRSVMSKTMIAACARAVIGGVKYDYVPIIEGKQGVGKSTLVRRIGKADRGWHTDSLTSFGDKESAEIIQGMWIVELGELAALGRREIETVKQFITKTSDDFRVPYGRHVQSHPRRCVFIGTTNKKEILKDPTGNRRFLPVACDAVPRTKDVFEIPEDEIDQMWAEAYHRWKNKESLLMPREAAGIALEMQDLYKVENPLFGQIQEHLKKKVVDDWHNLGWTDRIAFLAHETSNPAVAESDEPMYHDRMYVCPKEIWYEMMSGGTREPDNRTLDMIKEALNDMPGWERIGKQKWFGILGPQKTGYRRVEGSN